MAATLLLSIAGWATKEVIQSRRAMAESREHSPLTAEQAARQADRAARAVEKSRLAARAPIDRAIAAQKVCLGMDANDVVAAWGRPERINRTIAATCTGADPCRACKDCSRCKHCDPKNPKGGSCGVCRDQTAAESARRRAKQRPRF